MKLTLKHLIISVALLSVILTLFNSISSGYRIDKQTLMENTLETNRVYAQKLAKTTDDYIQMTFQMLEISSTKIAEDMKNSHYEELLFHEAERLKNQTNTFNSVVIASADGIVLSTSPQTLDIIGKKLNSPGGKQALKEKRPLISKPYSGLTGRLIVFISHPILDDAGNYLGLVGGTFYLEEKNILHDLLGEHFYQDGSYVFVVDEDGRIIYHQTSERVNDIVSENLIVQQLMQGKSGSTRVTNTKNIEMLAGYSYIPTANWGVVSQRPLDVSIAPSKNMIKKMMLKTLPFLLLSLFIIWFISNLIATPLQKLALYTESSTEHNQDEAIKSVSTWYYEAIQLKKALTYSLNFFQNKVDHFMYESTTDPLTKLVNRRTLDEQMRKLEENSTPFSIILIDIDHFKRVNDKYGHASGDEVLKFLAEKMKSFSRDDDICCRYGGEEFILLLPEADQKDALKVAERLRMELENTVSPCGEIITLSSGIASYPDDTTHPTALIELADQCLYEAKRSGRNKCITPNLL